MRRGRFRQYVASTISQLSVLVGAAAFCWFEPITLRLTEDPELSLTPEDVSWLVSIIEVGCLVSPILSGAMSDRIGRKYVILSISPLCLMGWLMILISKSVWTLTLVRIIHGLAVGVVFTVTPIYTAEIAEPKLRGSLSGTFQTTWYLGMLFSFCLGPYLSYDNFVYACLPLPVIFWIIFAFMPETPYFLLMSEKEDEAREVLRWLRDSVEVEQELAGMQTAVREEMSRKSSWWTLFTDKMERKAFIIVQIVSITKYLTGMPVIVNYASETFSRSDSFLPPEQMSMILGALLTGIAVLAAFMSDWIGRKPLLLLSCFGCFFSHLLTGIYYFLHERTSVDATPYIWMMYLGLAMYCFFSDIGLGPLLQTLQSEMFGASTRGIAAGITEAFAAVLSFAALKSYNPVNEMIGVFMNFWSYSAVGLVGGLLLLWLMYETAGKTIGNMEQQHRVKSSEGHTNQGFKECL